MPHQRMAWLIKLGCSLAPGGGLRGMHFIAMPALDLCATVRYDPWITLAPHAAQPARRAGNHTADQASFADAARTVGASSCSTREAS